MTGSSPGHKLRRKTLRWLTRLVGCGAMALIAAPAQAYIGPSYLQVLDVDGGWQGADYRDWVRLESNYWNENPPRIAPLYNNSSRNFFSGPQAPRSGHGQLALALDKRNPAYARMMALCTAKQVIPELSYAESSERARPPAELGERPPTVPEYFEYKLKNVRLSCPEVAEAPEQALILRFQDIEWLNYQGKGEPSLAVPVSLPPAARGGATRAFVITWFLSANNVAPDQCPVMARGPTEAKFYSLMTPEHAAAKKAELAPRGGVLAVSGAIAARGPEQLTVPLLPGIVPDPGLPAPAINAARGFDLDGDVQPKGTGAQRKAWVSDSGQPGVDNQLFAVDGCIRGWGHDGILTVTTAESRRNGEISWVIMVSGIDDERNDDRVDVTLFFSKDPMVKSADGKDILPGFTFRVSDDPQRLPYFQRLRGRIVDGAVVTEPADEIKIDRSRDDLRLVNGRMRLEMKPGRTLKGLIGGYLDWRRLAHAAGVNTFLESGLGYTVPGVYNAFKRAADGLPDPVTGEMTAVSAAYDVEGVEVFLPPEQERDLLAGGLAYLK
jgi:hypothetical protein